MAVIIEHISIEKESYINLFYLLRGEGPKDTNATVRTSRQQAGGWNDTNREVHPPRHTMNT